MKFRVWGGRPTLATTQGKVITSPESLEGWIRKQPDGDLEVEIMPGRWAKLAAEAIPYKVSEGRCFCAHPKYRSKIVQVDGGEFSGFFVHEAWRRAKILTGFLPAFSKMLDEVLPDEA